MPSIIRGARRWGGREEVTPSLGRGEGVLGSSWRCPPWQHPPKLSSRGGRKVMRGMGARAVAFRCRLKNA